MTNWPTLQNVIPVTKARAKLGQLAAAAQDDKYFLLTNRGKPEAVLVDFNFWKKTLESLGKVYQKTYIDPALAPNTRIFSNREISQWEKEDKI